MSEKAFSSNYIVETNLQLSYILKTLLLELEYFKNVSGTFRLILAYLSLSNTFSNLLTIYLCTTFAKETINNIP